MMMKQICFLAVFYGLSQVNAVGQTETYLELNVKDTIQRQAIDIIYSIRLYDPTAYAESGHEKRFNLLGLKELDMILDELNISKIEQYPRDYSIDINTGKEDQGPLVQLPNVMRLEQLYDRLRDYDNVYGDIQEYQLEAMDPLELRLLDKLISSGRDKALQIAKMADKQLGELLILTESPIEISLGSDQTRLSNAWTFYPPLSALPQEYVQSMEPSVVLTKEVKMRFAWR